uniref:TSC22 domain family member 3 n=1 Tax=Anas platyrhynchos platyrhynchos TaxID=8840 RepID=A0A493T5F8_ANAPP
MSSSPGEECRSPVGLDCCSCCLDLANRSGPEEGAGGENNNPGSPTVSSFRQLQEQLVRKNLNTDKLSSIMRQDSLEPVVRDPCYLFNQGICNRNIDQTLLSILLLFHSAMGQVGVRVVRVGFRVRVRVRNGFKVWVRVRTGVSTGVKVCFRVCVTVVVRVGIKGGVGFRVGFKS